MTRMDFFYKWLFLGLSLLPVWFFELLVLNRITLLGVSPILLPVAGFAVAARQGSMTGAGFGLMVGIFCDAVYYGVDGFMTLGMCLLCCALGILAQYALRQGFLAFVVCAVLGLAVMIGMKVIIYRFVGTANFATLLSVAIPEFFLSLCFAPLVFLWYERVCRRVERFVH